MSARFRKRPVEVDAIQWNGEVVDSRGHPTPPRELTAFAPGAVSMTQVGSKTHGGPDEFLPCIRTLEGTMTIRPGDWVVRGTKGEFYPVKPDIFAETYEPIEGMSSLEEGDSAS